MEKIIVDEPILKVIDQIKESKKDSILLIGKSETGKTEVIKKYLESNNLFTVNCTLSIDEMAPITDVSVFKLYHICLIIKKILENIKSNFILESNDFFGEYEVNIKLILNYIEGMYMTGLYQDKVKYFGKEICDNPEIIFDDFAKKIKKYVNDHTFELVFDNFDVIGDSSNLYQTFIYNLLKGKFYSIYVIRDVNTVLDKKDELLKDNDIIEVNYSHDINEVRKILEAMFLSDILSKNFDKPRDITFINLDDEIIELLINITNGSLTEMYIIVHKLYISKVKPELYHDYILFYYEKRLEALEEYNKVINGIKLHI